MEILKSHTEMENPEKNEETALPVVEAVEPVTGTPDAVIWQKIRTGRDPGKDRKLEEFLS